MQVNLIPNGKERNQRNETRRITSNPRETEETRGFEPETQEGLTDLFAA